MFRNTSLVTKLWNIWNELRKETVNEDSIYEFRRLCGTKESLRDEAPLV